MKSPAKTAKEESRKYFLKINFITVLKVNLKFELFKSFVDISCC